MAWLPPSPPGGATLLLSSPVPPGTAAGAFGVQALLADPAAPAHGVSGTPGLLIDVQP